jgi:two-component system, chemotaxis family, chemotaxis protein CheY
VTRSANATQKKVLVVDDDADWREFLKICLHELGYEAVEASNGVDALATIARGGLSIVLLDMNMPGMTGEDVVQRLPPGAPRIVFLTAAPADQVGSALRHGPHYYLPKGATREQLSLLLDSLKAAA